MDSSRTTPPQIKQSEDGQTFSTFPRHSRVLSQEVRKNNSEQVKSKFPDRTFSQKLLDKGAKVTNSPFITNQIPGQEPTDSDIRVPSPVVLGNYGWDVKKQSSPHPKSEHCGLGRQKTFSHSNIFRSLERQLKCNELKKAAVIHIFQFKLKNIYMT